MLLKPSRASKTSKVELSNIASAAIRPAQTCLPERFRTKAASNPATARSCMGISRGSLSKVLKTASVPTTPANRKQVN